MRITDPYKRQPVCQHDNLDYLCAVALRDSSSLALHDFARQRYSRLKAMASSDEYVTDWIPLEVAPSANNSAAPAPPLFRDQHSLLGVFQLPDSSMQACSRRPTHWTWTSTTNSTCSQTPARGQPLSPFKSSFLEVTRQPLPLSASSHFRALACFSVAARFDLFYPNNTSLPCCTYNDCIIRRLLSANLGLWRRMFDLGLHTPNLPGAHSALTQLNKNLMAFSCVFARSLYLQPFVRHDRSSSPFRRYTLGCSR